jgi:hypothetical protein
LDDIRQWKIVCSLGANVMIAIFHVNLLPIDG